MTPTIALSVAMPGCLTVVLPLPDASLLFVFNPCCMLAAALWIWKDTKTKQPPALTWQDEWKDLMTNPAHSGSSLPHSLTHSLARSLAHPLTHPSTHPPIHLFTHPLTHSPTHSLTYLLAHPLTHTHVLTHSFSSSPSALNECCCVHITQMGIAGTFCSQMQSAESACRKHSIIPRFGSVAESMLSLLLAGKLHAVWAFWQRNVQFLVACRADNSAEPRWSGTHGPHHPTRHTTSRCEHL